jgi:hypothetical protein
MQGSFFKTFCFDGAQQSEPVEIVETKNIKKDLKMIGVDGVQIENDEKVLIASACQPDTVPVVVEQLSGSRATMPLFTRLNMPEIVNDLATYHDRNSDRLAEHSEIISIAKKFAKKQISRMLASDDTDIREFTHFAKGYSTLAYLESDVVVGLIPLILE